MFKEYHGLKSEMYVLFFGRVVTAMGAFIWPMMTLIMTKKLHYSATAVASLIIVLSIINLPFGIIGGKLCDRFKKTTIIIVADLITVTSFMICSILPISIYSVYIFIFGSLFAYLEHPAYDALIADLSTTEQRSSAYSLSYFGYNLGFIIGPIIGSFLFANHLNLAFFLNGFMTLISTILIIFKVRGYQKVEVDQQSSFEKSASGHVFAVLWQRRPVIFYMLLAGLAGAVYMMIGFYLPIYMSNTFINDGVVYYGLLNSCNGIVVIICTPIITRYFKKQKDLHKFFLAVILWSISTWLFNFSVIGFIFLGMIIFTMGEVFEALARSPYITKRVPESHRGRITSITMVISGVITTVCQYTLGQLIDNYSATVVWNFILLVCVICGILILLLVKYDQRYFHNLTKEA